LVYYIL